MSRRPPGDPLLMAEAATPGTEFEASVSKSSQVAPVSARVKGSLVTPAPTGAGSTVRLSY